MIQLDLLKLDFDLKHFVFATICSIPGSVVILDLGSEFMDKPDLLIKYSYPLLMAIIIGMFAFHTSRIWASSRIIYFIDVDKIKEIASLDDHLREAEYNEFSKEVKSKEMRLFSRGLLFSPILIQSIVLCPTILRYYIYDNSNGDMLLDHFLFFIISLSVVMAIFKFITDYLYKRVSKRLSKIKKNVSPPQA